ncbi:peptidase [Streptococcus agalactiae]|uniref:peptidase n=1 Tax=Streptococcus agalactiae TaxID=1311 RepID=UPI0024BB7D4E|nr:peptidase [Streptococcus agalactiae]
MSFKTDYNTQSFVYFYSIHPVSDKEKSIIIDSNKAEVIALQDAGVVDKETIQVNVKEEFEDSLKVYEVRFKTKDKEYEYTIDVSGNILDKSTDTIDE